MPLILNADLYFPPLHHSTREGLLAVGGDLRMERLILAYSRGIFPWYDDTSPILWWAPPKRCILPLRLKTHELLPPQAGVSTHCVPSADSFIAASSMPSASLNTAVSSTTGGLNISRRLARKYKQSAFRHTLNTAFVAVIEHCAAVPRPGQDGTWITEDMKEAYVRLHEAGYAHSVECWHHEELIGGLYGVALGKVFFGESMFHVRADASKMALITLVQTLLQHDFHLLDCQQATSHMLRMGGEVISRNTFDALLKQALELGGKGMSSLAQSFSYKQRLAEKKFPLFPE